MIGNDVIKLCGITALAVLAGTQINMATHGGSVEEELMKKTGTTSIIWTWFGF